MEPDAQSPLNKEFMELLQTLPVEKGWASCSHCLYQGFWFEAPYILNAILSCRNSFQARNDDVFVASYPKSGTTWLKATVFALLDHSRRDVGSNSPQEPHALLVKSPHELVRFLECDLYLDNKNPDLSYFPSPRIFGTHIPYGLLPQSMKDSGCKIVYVRRNPKGTFASSWHFVNKLTQEERGEDSLVEDFDSFCKGICPFGSWWDHVLGYWKASLDMPERVLFLKYEDMKERPKEVIRTLADFAGCPFTEAEELDGAVDRVLRMCSFKNLSSAEVNKSGKLRGGMETSAFFRKGQVGDWMNLLSPEMAEKIDSITEEKLRGSGVKF